MNYSLLMCYSPEMRYIFAEFLILLIQWRKYKMDIQNYWDFPMLKSPNPQMTTTNMASRLCVCPWYCNL